MGDVSIDVELEHRIEGVSRCRPVLAWQVSYARPAQTLPNRRPDRPPSGHGRGHAARQAPGMTAHDHAERLGVATRGDPGLQHEGGPSLSNRASGAGSWATWRARPPALPPLGGASSLAHRVRSDFHSWLPLPSPGGGTLREGSLREQAAISPEWNGEAPPAQVPRPGWELVPAWCHEPGPQESICCPLASTA
jgi:hypothetical protein